MCIRDSSEAVVCGRPVLVTDLGALADRVKEMKCGWIVPHDATTQEILHQVDKIRLNPEMLEQMTDHVKNLRHKTISQMTGDYQLLYQRFDNVETQNKGHLFDARRIYQGYLLGERIEGKAKMCIRDSYGPYQFPEKLIPLMIANALADKPLPVYGDVYKRQGQDRFFTGKNGL